MKDTGPARYCVSIHTLRNKLSSTLPAGIGLRYLVCAWLLNEFYGPQDLTVL